MSRLRGQLVLALLVVLVGAMRPTIAAESGDAVLVKAAELKKLGINARMLSLGVVSEDGRVLVCYERETNPRLIAQHRVWQLRIFEADWATKKTSLRSVWLPLASFDQLAISSDGKWLTVIGDWGTNFIGIDVATLTPHTIFKNQRGHVGFRSMPTVMWLQGDKFHTVGYFYDEGANVTKDAVVSIDPTGTSLADLHQVRDISRLMRRTQNYRNCYWFSSDQAYFGGFEPDKLVHLYAFTGPDALTPLDKAKVYVSLAVGQDRVVYIGRYADGSTRAAVADVASGKRWSVGDGSKPYQYLYMSKDGGTIMLSLFDRSNMKMTTWYGREASSFALHAVPGLDRVFAGTIRFSPRGEVLAFFNPEGLRLQRLPSP